jgi:5-methylcytosine-specific restriction protein A
VALHHIQHWIDHGLTNLDNLVLLCRHHHRMLHHPEWTIRVRDGIPEFIPPKWIDPLQRPMRNVIRQ